MANHKPPLYRTSSHSRLAIFVDAWNLKNAAFDGLGMRVDFTKLLDHLSSGALLIRAYYYTGEWTRDSIESYLQVSGKDQQTRESLEEQLRADRGFWRFLSRNGYKVVKKPVRVFRDRAGEIALKADLDLELTIDMLTLADRCDEQILVSGDGDFVPLLNAVAAKGVRLTVVSTQSDQARSSANYRSSDELLDAADRFIDLESIRPQIERTT